jgi:hypothetical protein
VLDLKIRPPGPVLKIAGPPNLRCPKCGATGSAGFGAQGVVSMMIVGHEGFYCLACYADWLSKNIPKMESFT